MSKIREEKRKRRHARVRSKVVGTSSRPRLAVFKSNRFVYAQVIDDSKGHTLAQVSTAEAEGKDLVEKARQAGKTLSEKTLEKKVKTVVFDKGGFNYTGKIRALAEGAREGGLEF